MKVKLTKGELKKQRDALKQYARYLPTLQLKKQQLQIEIIRQNSRLAEKAAALELKHRSIEPWAGILADQGVKVDSLVKLARVNSDTRNIAGVDVPVFGSADFEAFDYDLFLAPLWVDSAVEACKALVSLQQELAVVQSGVRILKQELRVTTQRVNLFEKVKIPEAEVAIRLIKIYIGDQMANAVGRSKIAKRKIEEAELAGAY
ncbi:MAG: V-type ATP synthase subunit D [Candidatus Omnitrophota bacterium]